MTQKRDIILACKRFRVLSCPFEIRGIVILANDFVGGNYVSLKGHRVQTIFPAIYLTKLINLREELHNDLFKNNNMQK